MKTKGDRDESSVSDIGQVAAAFFIGLMGLLVLAIAASGRFDAETGVLLAVAAASIVVMARIGGAALTKIRTWITAIKFTGVIMIAIGTLTFVTGHHAVGRERIWTKVDRDSDLYLVAIGFLILGTVLVGESVGKKRSTSIKSSRTRRYRQPR